MISEAVGPFCSSCCLPCVSIYLAWLTLSITFPLQLLFWAQCRHTTGGASVVQLMQYPSSLHRQLRPKSHICLFKWYLVQIKSQLCVRLKMCTLRLNLVVFGLLSHTRMTEDGGCSFCKDESYPRKTLSSNVDIKPCFWVCIVDRFWMSMYAKPPYIRWLSPPSGLQGWLSVW